MTYKFGYYSSPFYSFKLAFMDKNNANFELELMVLKVVKLLLDNS